VFTALQQTRNDTDKKHQPLACNAKAISEKLTSAVCAHDA